MKRILLLGAGKSSAHLIRYLIQHAAEENWLITVGEQDVEAAGRRLPIHSSLSVVALNASNEVERRGEIAKADLVISMLPPFMHAAVARDCVDAGTSLITPSYVDESMQELHGQAKDRGVLLLNEMGVDPGIDHMSAMRLLDRVRGEGCEILRFESYTGGLVAPECDNNPWHYKVTWNPRNVVLAGYGGTARFRKGGELKYIPYSRLFRRVESIEVPGHGVFEGYANRDSLKYSNAYGLDTAGTLLRGTLRKQGFCAAWNALIEIGLTDDSFLIQDAHAITWRQLTASFAEGSTADQIREELARRFNWDNHTLDMLHWLGIFDEVKLGIAEGTPAMALQKLIESKWKMEDGDRDMIVMSHRVGVRQGSHDRSIHSWFVTEGEDAVFTAMSQTVGLPIAIAAKHILRGTWKMTGVIIPVIPEIYNPVLDELAAFGLSFSESEHEAGK